MDHITTTIASATPEQIARAAVLAKDFAALSGIQPWSGATSHRLPLYNIMLADRAPTPESAKVPATTAGAVPNYLLPVSQDGDTQAADRVALLNWLCRWPVTVTQVRMNAPRAGASVIVSREALIGMLED